MIHTRHLIIFFSSRIKPLILFLYGSFTAGLPSCFSFCKVRITFFFFQSFISVIWLVFRPLFSQRRSALFAISLIPTSPPSLSDVYLFFWGTASIAYKSRQNPFFFLCFLRSPDSSSELSLSSLFLVHPSHFPLNR